MGFAVTDHVWEHSRAKGDELLLLLALARRADNDHWECWPSRAELARTIRRDERTVKRLVAKLVDLGELAVTHQDGPVPLKGFNAGRADRRTNRYRVLAPADDRTSVSSREEADGGTLLSPREDERGDKSGRNGGTDLAETGGQLCPPNKSLNKSLESVTTNSRVRPRATVTPQDVKRATKAGAARGGKGLAPTRRAHVEPPGFADFWAAYPRRVARAKSATAYGKAVSNGATPAGIAAGLAAWASYWSAKGTDEEFIPHPTTWLNQERYNDEPPAPGRAEPKGFAGIRAVIEKQPDIERSPDHPKKALPR